VLEAFQQFDARQLAQPGLVETPWIEWSLRVNGRPLDPYTAFRCLLNRWGECVNRLGISLEEGSVIEVAARGVPHRLPGNPARAGRIGARLMGRYWFDDPHAPPRPR
jgi:hypothetical protein